jgi:ABC-type spermidine/putrescine transport system permease subunit II
MTPASPPRATTQPFLRAFVSPAALCAVGLIAAMAAVLQYSLRAHIPGSLDAGGFTLENFSTLLKPLYARVFLDTVWICLLTAFFALLLGYPLAYALVRTPNVLVKSAILVTAVTPLFLGEVVRTYSWIIVLGNNGFVNAMLLKAGLIEQPLQLMFTTFGVVVALVHVTLPVMVIMLAAALAHIDRERDDVVPSRDVGAHLSQRCLGRRVGRVPQALDAAPSVLGSDRAHEHTHAAGRRVADDRQHLVDRQGLVTDRNQPHGPRLRHDPLPRLRLRRISAAVPTSATAAPAAPSAASLRSTRRAATACRPRTPSSSTPRQVSLSYAARQPAARSRSEDTAHGYTTYARSLAGAGNRPTRCSRCAVPIASAAGSSIRRIPLSFSSRS